jgi:hypothetical protein
MLSVLIGDSLCNYTLTLLIEFVVLVHLCINLPNKDIVKVETCRRVISANYYLSLIMKLLLLNILLIYCTEYGLH